MLVRMSEVPLIDAHLHLLDPERFDYAWLDELPQIQRRYTLEEFDEDREGVEVERVVFVQADCAPQQGEAEAAWVLAQGRSDPRIAGLVAFAPLELGEGCYKLLERFAGEPGVVGVRRLLQDEPDPNFCLAPPFLEAVRRLGALGLVFEACVRGPQLPAVVELARRCEDTRVVLDHLGKPPIREHRLDPWRGHLAALAERPNTYAKLSGLVTEADPGRWTAAELAPYVDHALATFGPARLVFGGDAPIVNLAGGWRRWCFAFEELTAPLTVAERALLRRNTARELYGLS